MATIDNVGGSHGQAGEPFPGKPRDISRVAPLHRERRAAVPDRRVCYDRREMIRFEEDRRDGIDRRAGRGDPWLFG